MFACVYVPDFPVEAIARVEPLLRERAIAVLEGKPPLTRVVALNEKARMMGIEAGMTKLQAAVFAESTASIIQTTANGHTPRRNNIDAAVLRQRSLAQEKAAHSALLDTVHAFTPNVEDTASDTLLLDLAGLERLHGTTANMACDLATRVARIGIEANIAVAANPDAAMHAARGFTGTTVIPAGKEAHRLGALPVHILLDAFEISSQENPRSKLSMREQEKVHEQMLDTLERWGVRDFRMLGQLPEHALAARLGEAGAKLRRLALGEGMRTLEMCAPPMHFEEAVELECPVESIDSLSFVLNLLLERLCTRLEARALAIQELCLRLQLERRVADEEARTVQELADSEIFSASHTTGAAPVFERRLRLPVATRDTKVFLKLLQLDLAANPPGAPVNKVWIVAEPAPPRSAQRGLFLPVAPETEKLEITLARIKAIIGERRAGNARLLDSHRPESFRLDPFEIPANESSTPGDATLSDTVPSLMAMRIFRPACQLRVHLSEGRPTSLTVDPKESGRKELKGKILWSAGPWHSSGDWWTESARPGGSGSEPGPWDREEWDIALLCEGRNDANGDVALYRIYRDLATGRWFADASYD